MRRNLTINELVTAEIYDSEELVEYDEEPRFFITQNQILFGKNICTLGIVVEKTIDPNTQQVNLKMMDHNGKSHLLAYAPSNDLLLEKLSQVNKFSVLLLFGKINVLKKEDKNNQEFLWKTFAISSFHDIPKEKIRIATEFWYLSTIRERIGNKILPDSHMIKIMDQHQIRYQKEENNYIQLGNLQAPLPKIKKPAKAKQENTIKQQKALLLAYLSDNSQTGVSLQQMAEHIQTNTEQIKRLITEIKKDLEEKQIPREITLDSQNGEIKYKFEG